jgi:hypothetical protein
MKKIKEQLFWVSRTLTALSRQIDKLARQVAAAAPGNAGRHAAAGVPAARKDTLLDCVYGAIRQSRKGISIPELRKKTGLGARQLSNALYKLTKKGIVQTSSRGIYIKK